MQVPFGLACFSKCGSGSPIHCIYFKPSERDPHKSIKVFKFQPIAQVACDCIFLGKYSQIAILDGMCLIIYLTILHKFRPICVPFQIATTYAPSLKYRFRLTLILKCFRKFQEFFLTHVTFFFGVLKFHQYPFQAQFGIFVIRSLSLLVLSRELKQFGCIVY